MTVEEIHSLNLFGGMDTTFVRHYIAQHLTKISSTRIQPESSLGQLLLLGYRDQNSTWTREEVLKMNIKVWYYKQVEPEPLELFEQP
jgi:hypothetical protein